MAKSYNIVVLPGDGIGPEVTGEAVRVLELITSKSKDVDIKVQSVSSTALVAICNPTQPEIDCFVFSI